jgi:hypothetical protein
MGQKSAFQVTFVQTGLAENAFCLVNCAEGLFAFSVKEMKRREK